MESPDGRAMLQRTIPWLSSVKRLAPAGPDACRVHGKLAQGEMRPSGAVWSKNRQQRRWMSVEGAESDEDQHEIMFYSLRHAATVTLKEMHHFGAQVFCILNLLRPRRNMFCARCTPARLPSGFGQEWQGQGLLFQCASSVGGTHLKYLNVQANNKRTLLLAAQFLHEELPIRLARRVRELKKLPFGLGETDAIKEVRKLYEKSFFQIRRSPEPRTTETEEQFTQVLDKMMSEHNNVQATIARGLQELHNAGDKRIRSVSGSVSRHFVLPRSACLNPNIARP